MNSLKLRPQERLGIEADIARLEALLRQLKVQYDMFFAGGLPTQPLHLRIEVEKLIKRYRNEPIGKYHHRFHFNALVARFNALSELWTKTIRTLEEGARRGPQISGKGAEELLSSVKISHSNGDELQLRRLHSRFLEARQELGQNAEVAYEAFRRGIDLQAQRLRKSSGCDEIELRLVLRDHKVQLTARRGS